MHGLVLWTLAPRRQDSARVRFSAPPPVSLDRTRPPLAPRLTNMPKPTDIPVETLVPLGTSPTPVWPDPRVPLGPGQGSGCTTWRVDLETVDPDLYQPPRTLYVRCPMHGMHGRDLGTTLTFSNLLEDSTVGELKAAVDERLLLRPEQRVRLFSWGRELEDDAKTLAEYFVPEKTRLEMQLTISSRAEGDLVMVRVRVRVRVRVSSA